MRDGVQEAVLPLIAPDLADQEDGVKDETGNEYAEEDYAENNVNNPALIDGDDNPSHVERDGQPHQANAESNEKGDGPAPARDIHRSYCRVKGKR